MLKATNMSDFFSREVVLHHEPGRKQEAELLIPELINVQRKNCG